MGLGRDVSETKAGATHPIVFLLLCTPFGAANGYLVVTLAYLLHQAGVGAPQHFLS